MKKLISMLAALAVVTTGTAAFATDFTVETKNAEGETVTSTMAATDAATQATYEADEDGLYTVDLASVAGTQDQTTILAVEGKTIKVGSIKYINQSATQSFTFGMDANEDVVYVLAGGSAINPTLVGTIAAPSNEPETFTISGTVTGFVGSATLPTVVVTDGTNSYTATVSADGAFTVNVPTGATYTVKATKAGHLSYTKANIADTATVAATLRAGDMNADNIANVSDMALIVDNYNAENGGNGYTAAYDVNEDNILNVSDMALVVDNYNAEAISE